MLLLLAFLLPFPWVYSYIEAKNHLKRIIANGSKANLRYTFHRQALTMRFVWIQFFGLAVSTVWLWCTGEFPFGLYAVWSVYAWAVFGYHFTITLNRIRHAKFPDYNISPWYVSKQENAAWSDRKLVQYAALFRVTPEELAQRIYTGFLVLSAAGLFAYVVGKMLITN